MNKNSGIIFLAVFFLVTGGLSAQNAQELRVGSTASGNLPPNSELWYSVRATQEGTLIVETHSDIDTILAVYDSQRRNMIDEDDDGGEGYNACLEIPVTSGTTYMFKLRGFEGEGGPFSISAKFKVIAPPVALRFGNRVDAQLSSRDEHRYTVRVTEAGTVVVETSGSMDTVMKAYDSSNKLLEEDDDGGNGNNARIEIDAAAGQTYTFTVRGYGGESGSYGVIATYMAYPPDERNTERSRAVTLQLGVVLQVRLITTNESRWFSYNMPRPGRFVVQTKGNMDTELNLYDSRGTRIVGDDDSGDGSNACISENIEAGTYYIEVKSHIGRTGRCTLHSEIW